MNDRVLSSYVATVSQLSGCLQFMETAESQEDEDDSDEDDMKANLFKAAEQDVIITYYSFFWPQNYPEILFFFS